MTPEARAIILAGGPGTRPRPDESYEPEVFGPAGTIAANADNFGEVALGRMLAFRRSHGDPSAMLPFGAPGPSAREIAEPDGEGQGVSLVGKPEAAGSDPAISDVRVVDPDACREIAAMGAFDVGFEVLPRFVCRMRGRPWEAYYP